MGIPANLSPQLLNSFLCILHHNEFIRHPVPYCKSIDNSDKLPQPSARPIPSLQHTWFLSNTVGEPLMNRDTDSSGFNAALPWRGHFKATA